MEPITLPNGHCFYGEYSLDWNDYYKFIPTDPIPFLYTN